MRTKKPTSKRTTKSLNGESVNVVQTFGSHITELRNRCLVVVAVFLVASTLAYSFRNYLVAAILAPIGGEKLVYLTPAGGFTFIFEISVYTGALVSAPFAIYQLYKFLAPALPINARRGTAGMLLSATILMTIGASFGYFIAIPGALRFLTEFADGWVVASLTADSYLNFVAAYVLGLGLMFELPLLLILINNVTPLKPGTLWKSQRFVIIGAFIAAAIITPTPDAANQIIIALPIIIVYQVGVIAVWSRNRKLRSQTKTQREITVTPPPPLPTVSKVAPNPARVNQRRKALPQKSIDGISQANQPRVLQPSRRSGHSSH